MNILSIHEQLLTELSELNDNENRLFYILNVTPILEKYKHELSKPIELSFMGEEEVTPNATLTTLTDEYIKIARKYQPDLMIKYTSKNKEACTTCSRCSEYVDAHVSVCSSCGMEKDIVHLSFSYKDADRINITSKYTYDRRVHFRDCINQFQGKQNSTIKPIVYEKLIEQLNLHNLVTEGENLPKTVKYHRVTKNHIAMFLKEIGYSKHYEDINLIYHTLTERPLPDISHLESKLMADFDILSHAYNEQYVKTRKIERKNFINTQYVLFQLLRRHKYECSRNDFNFLKTIERKCFHDDICSELFKQLGWNFTNIF
jgi:hypothetical protein